MHAVALDEARQAGKALGAPSAAAA
jgi:hypothetical protein